MDKPSDNVDAVDDNKRSFYFIYWLILITTIALLAIVPDQAKWVTTSRGWYTQPMLGPILGLSVLAFFAVARLVLSFKFSDLKNVNLIEAFFESLSEYRVAIFSSVLFVIYINTLSVFGFALATLLFVSTLLWLSRLLNRFWFGWTVATLSIMILIFRVVVSVWLPDSWLYNLLPEEWASLANQYL